MKSSKGIESFVKELDIQKHAELTKLSRDIKLSLNGDYQNQKIMDLKVRKCWFIMHTVMGAGGGGFSSVGLQKINMHK